MLIGFSVGGIIPWLVLAAIAIGYAGIATWLGRRAGRAVFLPLWVLATVLAAVIGSVRLSPPWSFFESAGRQDDITATSFTGSSEGFLTTVLFLTAAFGAVTLYVFRRWRRGATTFGPGVALWSAGAFFAALIVMVLAFVLWTIASHFI